MHYPIREVNPPRIVSAQLRAEEMGNCHTWQIEGRYPRGHATEFQQMLRKLESEARNDE